MIYDSTTLLLFAVIIIAGLVIAELTRLNARLRKVFSGKNAEDLEDTLVKIIEHIHALELVSQKVGERTDHIDRRLRQSIQKCHTLRFNPFPDQGGNQSFATCFINEEGKGVIISSLYARDKVSVYAKPVDDFNSMHELSEEEKEVLRLAKNN